MLINLACQVLHNPQTQSMIKKGWVTKEGILKSLLGITKLASFEKCIGHN